MAEGNTNTNHVYCALLFAGNNFISVSFSRALGGRIAGHENVTAGRFRGLTPPVVGVEVLTGWAALLAGRTLVAEEVLRAVRVRQKVVAGVGRTASVRTAGGLGRTEQGGDHGQQEQGDQCQWGLHF